MSEMLLDFTDGVALWYYRFMRTTVVRNLRMNALKLAAIGMLSIIFLVSIGLVVGAGGMGTDHESMIGCPFMAGENTLCPMGVVGNLAVWQGLAGSIPERFGLITALSTVLVVLVFLGVREREQWKRSSISLGLRQVLYEKHFLDTRLFVFVKKLFSQGILNPKIFSAYVA